MSQRNIVFAVVTVLGLIADQASKWWIIQNIALHTGEIEVFNGPIALSIVHAQNPGAAFGLLRDFAWRQEVFLLFTLVAFWVIWDMLRKLPQTAIFMSVTLGLIMSGAIGNFIDRLRMGVVTDFIRVFTEDPSIISTLAGFGIGHEYPSFNIADVALVVGVILYFLDYLFTSADEPSESAPEPETEAPATE